MKDSCVDNIGERLRCARIAAGLTQSELSALTQGVVWQSEISAIERLLTNDPGFSKVVALEKALGLPPGGLTYPPSTDQGDGQIQNAS